VILTNSFAANWSSVDDATGYIIDVAYDIDFVNIVPGYNSLDIGNNTGCIVDSLTTDLVYYYRVRAYNNYGNSGYSNIEAVYVTESVVIGTQVWMTKNVKVNLSGSKVYDNDENNRVLYGGLYKFGMWQDIESLHPGWVVPQMASAMVLRDYQGGELIAGESLKEAGIIRWDPPNTASNSSNFTGVGAGVYYQNTDTFELLKEVGCIMIRPFMIDTDLNHYYIIVNNIDDTCSIAGEGGTPPLADKLFLSIRLMRENNSLTVDNGSITADSDMITVDAM
jgi:uncharacterized protein (TIGR02145 family)